MQEAGLLPPLCACLWLVVPVFLDDLQYSDGNRYPCKWIHTASLVSAARDAPPFVCENFAERPNRWTPKLRQVGSSNKMESVSVMLPFLRKVPEGSSPLAVHNKLHRGFCHPGCYALGLHCNPGASQRWRSVTQFYFHKHTGKSVHT